MALHIDGCPHETGGMIGDYCALWSHYARLMRRHWPHWTRRMPRPCGHFGSCLRCTPEAGFAIGQVRAVYFTRMESR